jgi:threonyl-tRNA synthetase
MLVVGENERTTGTVSLRGRDGSQKNGIPVAEFLALVHDRIAKRASEL